jgi:hypothetical protein
MRLREMIRRSIPRELCFLCRLRQISQSGKAQNCALPLKGVFAEGVKKH